MKKNTEQKKRGRPATPGGPVPMRSFRVLDGDWESWKQAADKTGESLTSWIHQACNAEMARNEKLSRRKELRMSLRGTGKSFAWVKNRRLKWGLCEPGKGSRYPYQVTWEDGRVTYAAIDGSFWHRDIKHEDDIVIVYAKKKTDPGPWLDKIKQKAKK
jgi:hypothetical protein